jgi:hypothetical protein
MPDAAMHFFLKLFAELRISKEALPTVPGPKSSLMSLL